MKKPKMNYDPKRGNVLIETGLVEDYRQSGWKPWSNPIDVEVIGDATCPACGHRGLEHHGFQSRDSRVAIAKCPKCGNEFEF